MFRGYGEWDACSGLNPGIVHGHCRLPLLTNGCREQELTRLPFEWKGRTNERAAAVKVSQGTTQRLAQYFQRLALELGQLVQEEDAVEGQAHLARL